MYRGKYQAKRKYSVLSWVLVCVAVLVMSIGGVTAYLSTQTKSLENVVVPDAPTDPVTLETFTEKVSLEKSHVMVDVGDPGYAVYVRAAVVITWQDDAGNVLADAPVRDTDYSITMGSDWFEYGGFWYCKTMVSSGNTPELITTCRVKTAKEGYHLNVDIITQTIQALGTTDEAVDSQGKPILVQPAVTAAWGIPVSTDEATMGQLYKPTP